MEIVNSLLGYLPALITAGIALATFIQTHRGAKTKQIVEEAIKPLVKGRDENRKSIEELAEVVDSIRGDTVRLQLSSLIHREPENVDTILKVAQFYFCDIKQNWWMASEFKKWAKQHEIEIPDDIWTALKRKHED